MKNTTHLLRTRLARGFTLVELMIVVAIITLLTALIMVDFVQTRGSARDGKRISDLAQIQLTLEQYFDRCGQYPTTLTLGANNGCPTSPTAITLGSFITQIPVPPGSSLNQTAYDYMPMDPNNKGFTGSPVPVDYLLHVTLEYPNPVQASGVSESSRASITSGYTVPTTWQVSSKCFDSTAAQGTAGANDYCIGPK